MDFTVHGTPSQTQLPHVALALPAINHGLEGLRCRRVLPVSSGLCPVKVGAGIWPLLVELLDPNFSGASAIQSQRLQV